jgi:hypothetical protein
LQEGEKPLGPDRHTNQYSRGLAPAESAFILAAQPLLICDGCQNVDVVVAIMQILQLEESWALFGACALELPTGFSVTEVSPARAAGPYALLLHFRQPRPLGCSAFVTV